MAQNNGPETSDGKSDNRPGGTPEEVGDLDGRRKSLDAALAKRVAGKQPPKRIAKRATAPVLPLP
jgi:hypothetical protein